MTYKVLLVDPATGKYKNSGVSLPGFSSDETTVGVGGVTQFILTNSTLTALSVVEVMINGVGVNFYTIDVLNNKIVFNRNIPQNAWIKVKVY
jgi:hypothetical protein